MPDGLRNRFISRALIAMPIAGAAAVVVWAARLGTIDMLLVIFAAGAVVDVLGVWWEERSRARQMHGTPEGVAKLVGNAGVVTASSGSHGTIRIGFELWEARSASTEPLAVGERVIVQHARGQTLFVEPRRPTPRRR